MIGWSYIKQVLPEPHITNIVWQSFLISNYQIFDDKLKTQFSTLPILVHYTNYYYWKYNGRKEAWAVFAVEYLKFRTESY